MAITKEKKSEIYQEYRAVMNGAAGLVVTEYRGMSMKDLSNIRKALRPAGGQYVVVKNTIFLIVLREYGFAAPEDLLSGPVAVAIAKTDIAKMTKAILGIKDAPLMILKGAVMGKTVFKADQLEVLSTLPTLEEARASLIGTMQTPATQFLSLISQPGQQLAQVLKAFTDKLEGGSTDAA